MKKNEKGFVLIELLIVAVFTATLFTLLYTNVIPLIGDYNQRENYDTLEIKYALYDIRKEILTISDGDWNKIKETVSSNGFARLSSYGDDSIVGLNTTFFGTEASKEEYGPKFNLKNMLSAYNFISLYITRYGVGTYTEETELPDDKYQSLKEVIKSNNFVDTSTSGILKQSEEYTQQYIKQMKNYTLGYEYKKDYYRIIGCISSTPTNFNSEDSYTSCGTIELMKK